MIMTLTDYCSANFIYAESDRLEFNPKTMPASWGEEGYGPANIFKVTLRRPGRSLSVYLPISVGLPWPSAQSALREAVLAVRQYLLTPQPGGIVTLEAWARLIGVLEPDQSEADLLPSYRWYFNDAVRLTKGLRRFLDDDTALFDQLVWQIPVTMKEYEDAKQSSR